MNKLLFRSFLSLTIAVTLVNCQKKAFDDYYNRPEGLEPPIYQVLQEKEEFSEMLACIDKAGYKDILGSAGYWTLFAPNNTAFAAFYKERNISGIQQLDSLTAQKIVRYCLVYNSFNKDRVDDYQANSGWVVNTAFRRRTAYYELFDTATVNSQLLRTVASNRNSGYISSDNNNKYLTYFTEPYMTGAKLSAADYNYFFPSATYSGFNIMDAKVVEPNVPAENGTIHVIDKVLMPMPSIDKYLAAHPEYSLFKSLFDRFLVSYVENADASKRYQVLYGGADKVFVKTYNTGLAFALNNENYLKTQDNDGQANNWTLFAPKNDVLKPYLESVVLEHFGKTLDNLGNLPNSIVIDFLNGHMCQQPVWPTKFATSGNFLGEEPRFNPSTDIIDKQVLSNGFFYGTNKVQSSNYFTTVYARPYLDPAYSLMTRLLNSDLRPLISNPNVKYTLFMMSDEALHRLSFDWDGNRSAWINTSATPASIIGAGDPRGTMSRFINMYVVSTPNGELNDLSGSGIVETIGGEMIRFENNKIYAAGNIDSGKYVSVTSSKVMSNGIVYYLDGLLYFSGKTPGKRLEELSATSASPYYNFFQYLKNSTLYTASTGAIGGIPLGFFGSFLIPDNNAIQAAVNDGFLPGTGTAPNKTPTFAPTDIPAQEQVARFIQYHILKKSIIGDGRTDGNIETMYRDLNDKVGYVTVDNLPGLFRFKDAKGRIATLNTTGSNVLADRIVFHSINTYLQNN
ncbi:MAG: fasciclin domain-containing protein [Chitinophagaceae bacterium]